MEILGVSKREKNEAKKSNDAPYRESITLIFNDVQCSLNFLKEVENPFFQTVTQKKSNIFRTLN